MRRVLVLVSALVALLAFGPLGAIGQEAMPEPQTSSGATSARAVSRAIAPRTATASRISVQTPRRAITVLGGQRESLNGFRSL
jgi:hypothetical protein